MTGDPGSLAVRALAGVEPLVVGTNHRLAPLELRERLAYPAAEISLALGRLRERLGPLEAVLLSTCNRTEVYAASGDAQGTARRLEGFLAADRGVPTEELAPTLYAFRGRDAVSHLFRVASSLDSLVIGETQIVGQVREAWIRARELAPLGGILDRLFYRALKTAREVHRETRVAEGAVSVASVAVDLMRRIFGDLRERCVLVVGGGKTAELVLRHLLGAGLGEVLVSNRTPERALALSAEYRARAVPFPPDAASLERVDVVVAATGASAPVLRTETVRAARRARPGRPLVLLDLGVPRDVEPSAHHLEGVYLYDLDALETASARNLERRRAEWLRGIEVVEREVAKFEAEPRRTLLDPMAAGLAEAFRRLGEEEATRLAARLRRFSPPGNAVEIEREAREACRRLANRILHRPLAALREGGRRGEAERVAEAVRILFGVEDGGSQAR